MHENAELITRFYDAFARKDHETMAACYAPGATFSDPVFPSLGYAELTAMWKMFCVRSKDLVVSSSDISGSDGSAGAKWQADYTFPPTGRHVRNVIDASFKIEDGRIIQHRDRFDLYRWTRMALGPMGSAMGWSPLVQNKVRKTAAAQLQSFMASEKEPTP